MRDVQIPQKWAIIGPPTECHLIDKLCDFTGGGGLSGPPVFPGFAYMLRDRSLFIYNIYVKECACVYVGLKAFHDACIILYTCKSSLYFILVLFLVVVYRGPHRRLAFFLLTVLPSENKDYHYYYYYYYYYHYYYYFKCQGGRLKVGGGGNINFHVVSRGGGGSPLTLASQ